MDIEKLSADAITLLRSLISTPSFSGSEERTADLIASFLADRGIECVRKDNNIIARNAQYDPAKPTLLLNSHHDTVKVAEGWTRDPFAGEMEDGIIYGLGANDAGASLVSLIATFIYYYNEELPYSILLAATAEEENFGPKGIKSLRDNILSVVSFGIVGEPTQMRMATAEKGLLVIDGVAHGFAGHAARKEGENAIYLAMEDIIAIKDHSFSKVSKVLGANVMSVTQIQGGHQHNVTPDTCRFTIDMRVNECYTLEEAFEEIDQMTKSELKARSFNNHPSGIDDSHPLVLAGKRIGLQSYGSPTLSDQANLSFPTIKIGPGVSSRSHTPDEYVKVQEIKEGISIYIALLEQLKNQEL